MDVTERQDLRKTIRRFCEREITRDYVRHCDRAHEPPIDAFKAVAQQGWLGINVDEEYGGLGGGPVELAILLEELGRSFLDLAFWVFRVLAWGGNAIGRDGTAEQKSQFLPSIAAGECSVCFALTEPESGSDAASIHTRAVRDGDDFVLTGQKMFTSGFVVSDYVLIVTKTSDAKGNRHSGFTNILVDCATPGLEARPIDTLGHWPLGTAALFLDEARVPATNVLGAVDGGWPNMVEYLKFERLSLSAARTGAARSALADAVEYAKTREQFGRPIGKFQAVSHRLAEMAMQVEISSMLVERYTERLEAGTTTDSDAAILKLYTSEAYKSVADLGLQVLGGYGYTMEYDLQRHFRESRLGTIGAGTSDIQRNIIARGLGL
jgi:acyl-CoA dehydrogenase